MELVSDGVGWSYVDNPFTAGELANRRTLSVSVLRGGQGAVTAVARKTVTCGVRGVG